jgi:glycosyltransferase involved in cell wall biosynthesis
MTPRIGYVWGGRPSAKVAAAIEAGVRPRPEYSLFLERNDARLLTFDDADRHRPPLVDRLVKRYPYWGLPLAALAKRHAFDAFLTTGDDVGLRLALLARARGARTPIFIISHGSYCGSRKLQPIMAMLRGASNVHFFPVAETLRRTWIDRFGVPASRVHNTGYATDTDFFRPVDPAPTPAIVSAGMTNRDYRTLVKATAHLDVPIKIAADSAWFPQQLDIEGDALPANYDVRSYDYLSLRDLYASASVVVVSVYPARHTAGITVITEAMAMGKPVIATRTEGSSDYVIEGETGYYVEPGDAVGMRARIDHLLANPDQAAEMGRRARALVERTASIESYCRRMEDAIQANLR